MKPFMALERSACIVLNLAFVLLILGSEHKYVTSNQVSKSNFFFLYNGRLCLCQSVVYRLLFITFVCVHSYFMLLV